MPFVSAPQALAPPRAVPDARALFPSGVGVLASPVEATLQGLFPEELALVARAVAKRQHEFATGRRLARRLLATLGCPDRALLADIDRVPRWPEGIVGSISHGHGLCAVAAVRRGEIRGLGIDVEEADAVRPELWRRVLRPDEEKWLRAQPDARQIHLAAVFFSAKEAVYKAQFPLRRARLGFHDVSVELDPAASLFEAHTPGFARPLGGTFSIALPWVLAGLAIPDEERAV
jgi:4'-phosphopantetheinyl transferase EntD